MQLQFHGKVLEMDLTEDTLYNYSMRGPMRPLETKKGGGGGSFGSVLPEKSPTFSLYKAHFAFSITDRKIKVIKSISADFEPGQEINSVSDVSELTAKILLNFIHPIYLPTMDEVVEEELELDIKKILRKYLKNKNVNEMSKV
jgi:hypothetical protein